MTWNAQKWLALFFVAGVVSGQTVLAQTNVFIGGYGNSRTNANLTETVLTPSTVKPGEFGKRFSLTVDGQIYAQPLYVRGGDSGTGPGYPSQFGKCPKQLGGGGRGCG